MSRLIRMAYGHGGTRLERILVTASPAQSKAMPHWLQFLLLFLWIVVLLLFSRYAVTTVPKLTTAIDTSRLELMPPPAIPEQPPVNPVEPPPLPPQQSAQEPQAQQQEDLAAPTITRPVQSAPVEPEYQPRIVRQRAQTAADDAATAAPQVRRPAAMAESTAERMTITRSRGAATADAPAAMERVAPLRRARGSEGTATAPGPELRPITRRDRPSGTISVGTPQVVATRERPAGIAADERGSSHLSISRGVTFASLDTCASPREEEEKITAVLGIVGGRQNCRDGSGEYRFRGTQRISSFNLMIYPVKGHKPTNRCEELENAYRCLKAR